MTRAEIRYADSSGVASGTIWARLSQARSPAWTSHPATSSRTHRRLRAAGSGRTEPTGDAAATSAEPARSRGRTTDSQPSAPTPVRSGVPPGDPAGRLVGGHDPPPRRVLRPAGRRGLAGRPAGLDHAHPGRRGLGRVEELQLGPGHLERLRGPQVVG